MKKALLQVYLLLLFMASMYNSQAQIIQVSAHKKISGLTEPMSTVLNVGDFFGGAVTSMGDFNGDGFEDLMVGARHDSEFGHDKGAIWVLFLDGNQDVLQYQKIGENYGGFSGNLSVDGVFGTDIANLGDLDGDGITDFAVGASSSSTDGYRVGEVWILLMNANGTVKENRRISKYSNSELVSGIMDDSRFGKSIDRLGDLDGDGITEIIVSGYLDGEVAQNQGAVWILFLNNDGSVKDVQKINSLQGGFEGDLSGAKGFGYGVATLADMDGDDIPEVAVGCRGDNDGGNFTGAVWILFLDENGMVKSEQKISALVGGFYGVLEAGDQFGNSVSNAGDLNQDGIDDLLVGAWRDDDGVEDSGAIWVLLLNEDGTVKDFDKISNTESNFTGDIEQDDLFAFALESVPDMNGDGVREIVVGAKADDDGGYDIGAVYILYSELETTSLDNQSIQDNISCSVYPNPAQFEVTLDFSAPYLGKVEYRIFTSEGKLIKNGRFTKLSESQKQQIDLSGIADTYLLLQIAFGEKQLTKKLLLSK